MQPLKNKIFAFNFIGMLHQIVNWLLDKYLYNLVVTTHKASSDYTLPGKQPGLTIIIILLFF